MATPLLDRSKLNSIIAAITKRFAFLMDGQTVELGRTGHRDISHTLQNVTDAAAGGLVCARDGNIVQVSVAATPNASGSVLITSSPLFASFSPMTTIWDAGRGGNIGITTGGSVYIQGGTPGTKVYGTLVYTTENGWPGGLPGVELGQPVVI